MDPDRTRLLEQIAAGGLIEIGPFMAFTCGILVYFIGRDLTRRFPILSAYSIPEPVSGGIIAACVTFAIVSFTGREISFDLYMRDYLLVYFFTTVGLNARFTDLLRGGPLLAIMLAITIGYMLIQNTVGVIGATLFGMPPAGGIMLGTAALIGGHGTAIAWGPIVEDQYGVVGAAELGIASATVGLIMASLLGGPIAKLLIERNDLKPDPADLDAPAATVVKESEGASEGIHHISLMRAIFWIHIAIIIGFIAYEGLQAAGVMLPLFVPCLLAGILLSNTLPPVFKKMTWPAGSASLNLVGEFSLSVFLSMSLMSMQLWTLASSAGVLAFTMLLQAAVATVFIVYLVFRVMGRNYFAGVISAGFTGVTLGATPTAIANMNAVTHKYGPCPLAFILLPLISAFFVDIANAFIIQWFLAIFGGA